MTKQADAIEEALAPLEGATLERIHNLQTRLRLLEQELRRQKSTDLVRDPFVVRLARDYLLAMRSDGYTFQQIAEEYGVTLERAREVYKRLTGETEDLRTKAARASRG